MNPYIFLHCLILRFVGLRGVLGMAVGNQHSHIESPIDQVGSLLSSFIFFQKKLVTKGLLSMAFRAASISAISISSAPGYVLLGESLWNATFPMLRGFEH